MQSLQSAVNKQRNAFVIHTVSDNWVIPHNCELLKAIIDQQKLKARDLVFISDRECKKFIKELFLMALEDETKNHSPSKLAQLGRDLIVINQA